MPRRPRFLRRRRGKRSGMAKRLRTQAMKKYGGTLRSIRRLNSSNQGYLNVNRRLPVLSAATSQEVVGGLTVSDPTGSCISFGTPVPVVNGLSTVFDVPFAMKFRLDQLAGYTDFTQLFDQYKINAVKVFVRSYANSDGALSFPIPWLETWNDSDSASLPTLNQSREIMGVKHKYFSSSKNVCTMYVKPKPSVEVGGTSTTGLIPYGSSWIDCTDDQVPHYAIKGIIHNYALPSVNTGNNRLEFDVIMNASFKDVQ